MNRRDLACWNCGELAVNEPLPLSRHAACQHCYEMLHCCLMCRHFDPSGKPTCQHDLADAPRESDSANFCDYLSPHYGRKRSSGRSENSATTSLAQLFGDDEGEDTLGENDEAERLSDAELRLKDLFGED